MRPLGGAWLPRTLVLQEGFLVAIGTPLPAPPEVLASEGTRALGPASAPTGMGIGWAGSSSACQGHEATAPPRLFLPTFNLPAQLSAQCVSVLLMGGEQGRVQAHPGE